jgi:hypothetical protein
MVCRNDLADGQSSHQTAQMRLLVALAVLVSPIRSVAAQHIEDEKHAPAHIHPRFFGHGAGRCSWHKLERQAPNLPMWEGVSIRFLGTIPARRHEYYIYHHVFLNPESLHGHQRILILGRGCIYAGEYYVMASPIYIHGNDIIFDAPKADGNVIHFANRLPPKEAWINGEINPFIR